MRGAAAAGRCDQRAALVCWTQAAAASRAALPDCLLMSAATRLTVFCLPSCLVFCPCSRCLMCHLREGEDLEAELRGVLLPEEVAELLAAEHRPNYCCQVGWCSVRSPACLPAACLPAACLPACLPGGARGRPATRRASLACRCCRAARGPRGAR